MTVDFAAFQSGLTPRPTVAAGRPLPTVVVYAPQTFANGRFHRFQIDPSNPKPSIAEVDWLG